MSKSNYKFEDGVEVGYKKKTTTQISFDDPKVIKENLKSEIDKLYPGAKYNLEVDSDIIYVNLYDDTEDFDFTFDGIEDLIDSSFNDTGDYVILVREISSEDRVE